MQKWQSSTIIFLLMATYCQSFVVTYFGQDVRFIRDRRTKTSYRPTSTSCFISISKGADADATPCLVVILPAYNERLRIGDTLSTYSSILASSDRWKGVTNLLVVDDGSNDGTAEFVSQQNWHLPLSCISLPYNQGKGAAVSFGIQHSVKAHQRQNHHSLVLIVDADGSGEMMCLDAVYSKLQELVLGDWTRPAIVVGNRGYQGTFSPTRAILRWGFRFCVKTLCGDLHAKDTQCGFKLMTKSAAQMLYTDLHLVGWSHDVEVLYRAKELGIPVGDVVVHWQDKDGSKLVESPGGTVGVSLTMLMDIIRMRFEYAIGSWKIPSHTDLPL